MMGMEFEMSYICKDGQWTIDVSAFGGQGGMGGFGDSSWTGFGGQGFGDSSWTGFGGQGGFGDSSWTGFGGQNGQWGGGSFGTVGGGDTTPTTEE